MANTTARQAREAFRLAVGLVLISGLAISFTISFVSFIYTGGLGEHLSKGIGLALLGVTIMPIVAVAISSYRGSIVHAQDVPALLLAGSAATIAGTLTASPEVVFPTIATLTGLSAILTGVALVAAGSFRLGAFARFIPYSVIGGFLAATGLLLTLGALGMVIKDELSVWSLSKLLEPTMPVRVLPWIALSVATVAAMRLYENDLILPSFLFLGAASFYLTLAFLGIDIGEASQLGLLLGPFETDNFLSGVSPNIVMDARWDLIMAEAPTLVAVAGIAFLGLLLNTSGIEVALNEDLNFERELQAGGVANICAGALGGLVGYHLLGETIFARRMGVGGVIASVCVALTAAAVLLLGADIVAALPVGLMASVIMILGLDLLYEWLVAQRKQLSKADTFVVWLILVAASTIGFLEALSLGLIAAVVVFVISCSQMDVIRLRTTLASRRSSLERARGDMRKLTEIGHSAHVYDLTDYLFFGTANALYELLKDRFENEERPSHVILNFSRVSGIDTSAIYSLLRLGDLCQQRDVTFVFAGATGNVAKQLSRLERHSTLEIEPSVDTAISRVEDALLATHAVAEDNAFQDILDQLKASYPALDATTFTERVSLAPGDVLIAEGSTSREIFQLVSGKLSAGVSAEGASITVARFLPGALVGEIAAFADTPRTATIRAETACTVLRLSLDDIPDSEQGRAALANLQRQATHALARRLMRMNNLVREIGL